MKATQPLDAFKPVTIVLETQAEVDALAAIMNNEPVTRDTPFESAENSVSVLKQYATGAMDAEHVALVKRLDARRK
jgi:hypothetical protein